MTTGLAHPAPAALAVAAADPAGAPWTRASRSSERHGHLRSGRGGHRRLHSVPFAARIHAFVFVDRPPALPTCSTRRSRWLMAIGRWRRRSCSAGSAETPQRCGRTSSRRVSSSEVRGRSADPDSSGPAHPGDRPEHSREIGPEPARRTSSLVAPGAPSGAATTPASRTCRSVSARYSPTASPSRVAATLLSGHSHLTPRTDPNHPAALTPKIQ